MTPFEPIAIVGQACLLPGAPSPTALWEAVRERRDLTGRVPPDRWGVSLREVMGTGPDRSWCDRGGYVAEAALDLQGFRLPAADLEKLDPLFHWLLHTGRQALGTLSGARAGAVIGNLSFPSQAMARFAERVWLARQGMGEALADAADLPPVAPENRFTSGLPAHLLARALGLGGEAFCLDAACASSLVAIKLACDRLHDRRADVMLAGAVSRADDLFIHVGFCALMAMSRSGQSRPFHPEADGLLPAEGAAMVALMRLEDALAEGREVLAVIRGLGLANDGRGHGLLAPSPDGQARAMLAAYARAGLSPADIDYVECHATGTPTGDRTELESMARVFDRRAEPLPIGSLKSNLGHLITAAGVAGLIKVIEAMRAETLPPTILDGAHDVASGSPFRVVRSAEPWPLRNGTRRAAISAFGFGGNDAHLIVEQQSSEAPARTRPERAPVAIVGLARRELAPGEEIVLGARGLRFPPRDLEQTLPQQILLLAAAQEAARDLELVRERTGVIIGMGCDPTVARYGARWRLAGWARTWGIAEASWIERSRDAFVPSLGAAGVVGTMPNIVANRVNSALDLGGASLTVSSEELSGLRAVEVGARAVACGELDAALVGAVDLSRDPVHEAALAALGIERPGADRAVVLVLERLDDARRRGHPVLAVLDEAVGAPALSLPDARAHAVTGLDALADAIAAGTSGRVEVTALFDQRGALAVRAVEPPRPHRADLGPELRFAAHPPPIALPPLPPPDELAPAPLAPESSAMPRAPALEPAIEPPDDGVAPLPIPAPPSLAVLVAIEQLAAHRARLSQQHAQFLAQQSAIHQDFLALRARQQRILSRGGVYPRPLPTPENRGGVSPRPLPPDSQSLPGPKLDRAGLMVHAGGAISEIFGPAFRDQDGFDRQVRMPLPPLLLADRMTGLDAEPGSMGLGTIWTETDVREDSWYLHRGRMPAGLMIEAGQADLMLISYLGVDRLNRSERVYRLLGCELTYHGALPQPGDTLAYDIHVDGHASQGDVRLFFFHYDCRIDGALRLSVRGGQAGFFSDEELADSAGVLWDAATGEHTPTPRLDAPPRLSERRRFDKAALVAFSEGRVRECFGPGFEMASTHTDTPRIAGDRMLFLDEVTDFDPAGGPWGRGYLRAVEHIGPDCWFFDGHFKNDPCMPGTLMFEGCLQTMAFYLTALGFTLERDGWRFEPVPEERYKMRCRGQVLPSSRELVYELFIEEVMDGPTPTIYADLLCTVDGLKAFHCRRMGLRLVPDWPLERILKKRPELLSSAPGPVAEVGGFRFDHTSLLACAWGRPTRAFGPMYRPFDSHRKVARLPGPPYHFMTRVEKIDGDMGSMQPGQRIEVAYDVPPEAWYFDDNGARTMPFCVLLEAALQPCGWLASFVGSALEGDVDLAFRNLDGTGELLAEIAPRAGTLRTRATITSISSSAGMIIESFEVSSRLGDAEIYRMRTVFGFFPKEALDAQVGLPVPEAEAGVLDAPSERSIDLTTRPERYFAHSARLASPFLMMIERVTGIWPDGGAAGLGRYRAEAGVDPDAWFLAAHFFQDPVQPGSLGLEAMIQLLQFAMLDRGMDEGLAGARFEPIALGVPLTWKYRGQVRVHNQRVHTVLDLTEIGEDERGRYAIAQASMYVDGMRIYEAKNLGMRLVGEPDEIVLDPTRERWLADHCPTYTVPALPLMSMVDRLAAAAARPDRVIAAVEDVRVLRWLPLPGPVRTRTELAPMGDDLVEVTLLAWRESARAKLSRFEPVARGRVRLAPSFDSAPPPWPPAEGVEQPDPYAAGHLFHGPALHKLARLWIGDRASRAELDPAPGSVPVGALHQALLDAATHAIPHDRLDGWCPDIAAGDVAYPYRLEQLTFYGPAPTAGSVRCEVRFSGLVEPRMPRFEIQLIAGERVWAQLSLIEIALPKGPLGQAPAVRVAFLRDRRFVPGVSLSRSDEGATRLTAAEVKANNWLPGTLETLYRHERGDLTEAIAKKEHVAREAGVHPGTVALGAEGAVSSAQPLTRHALRATREADEVVVRSVAPPRIDLAPVRRYWDRYFDIGRWPVEDLYYGLIQRFVRRVHVIDPDAFAGVRGRSVLYLANHQVAVESLLFSIIVSALNEVPTVTLAKAEHRGTWLGLLIRHCFAYPGVIDPEVITYFDRSDPSSLAGIIADLAAAMTGCGAPALRCAAGTRKSVMVHIEGTRSLSCRQPVVKMTSAFIDMALATRAPIVPVRFVGGLPGEPLDQRIELPIGMGRQDIYLGRPIEPDVFEALPYKDRKPVVIDALNALGPPNAAEEPFEGDPIFAERVAARVERTGASPEHAALFEVLAEQRDRHPAMARLLAGDAEGRLVLAGDPHDRWLAELARRLYGERGARIETP